MKQAKSRVLPGSSRLVRELTRVMPLELKPMHESFAENLSRKIDFSGSVKLSDVQGEVRIIKRRVDAGLYSVDSVTSNSLEEKLEQCQQAFVRVRRAIVQGIELSIDNHESARVGFPLLNDFVDQVGGGDLSQLDEKTLDKLVGAIEKHYRSLQSDMSGRVQGLKAHVRDEISPLSPDLAQLVLLDVALDETLSQASRQSLAQAAKLSGRFARKVIEDPMGENKDLFDSASIEQRYALLKREIKKLLLAELELRLQSTLGLIEAFNEHVNQKD